MTRWILALGGAIALLLMGTAPVSAAEVVEYDSVYNTDFAWAGVGGLDGVGEGEIVVVGVTGTVTRALLFWQGNATSSDENVNATVTIDGQDVTGTMIGKSSSNCWNEPFSYGYRADVTGMVTGDGTYQLTNFEKVGGKASGASIVIFFDNGDSTDDRDVVIYNGNDSDTTYAGPPADAEGWDVALSGIEYVGGDVSLDLIVADGQDGEDGPVYVNGTEIASGETFDGSSVPNAGEGQSRWDNTSFDVTQFLEPGTNDLNVTETYGNDCLALVVAMVNLPAGSAPGSPGTNPIDDEPEVSTTLPEDIAVPTYTG